MKTRTADTPTKPTKPTSPAGYVAAAVMVAAGFLAGSLGVRWLLAPASGHPEPVPIPRAVAAQQTARPGWHLTGSEVHLESQRFDVEHIDPEAPGYFSATITVSLDVVHAKDTPLPDGSWGEGIVVNLNNDRLTATDVVQQDPAGLAKVGWLQDLAPLPDYPYQAVTKGVAVFDNGIVTTDPSYELVFPVPQGATELRQLIITFDWLDQGRDLTFDVGR